jgi:hypothetical protein
MLFWHHGNCELPCCAVNNSREQLHTIDTILTQKLVSRQSWLATITGFIEASKSRVYAAHHNPDTEHHSLFKTYLKACGGGLVHLEK